MKTGAKDLQRSAPVLLSGGVILLAWGLQILSQSFPAFSPITRLENITYDWRVRWASQDRSAVSPDLAIVAIDDLSHTTISQTHQQVWPWPRFIHGKLVEELQAEGSRLIAFDILFLDPYHAFSDILEDGIPVASDVYFARSIRQFGNVLLAATGTTDSDHWRLEPPLPLFTEGALGTGHIVADVDSDGVLRRVKAYYDDPERGRVWHLAVLAAAAYLDMDMRLASVEPNRVILRGSQGQQRTIPTDKNGFFYVNWAFGLSEGQRREIIIPFKEFVSRWTQRRNGREPFALDVRDRLVFVGSLATGNNISDMGATPMASQDFLFTTHWNVANSILLNQFIQRSGFSTEMLLVLLIGLLSAVITWRLRALWASALLVTVLGAYFALAFFLFAQARYWLPIIGPGTTALLTYLSLVTYRSVAEQREKFRVKNIFSKVVSPDVVNELLSSETLGLGGSRRQVSVFFADIRGFTRLTDESQARAERDAREQGLGGLAAEAYLDAAAREILTTVNLYLGAVADTIKRHNGTFDKYIGDCAMAFWGAPTPNERHAADCVRAAVEAQQAIYDLNSRRSEQNQQQQAENERRRQAGQPALQPATLLSLGCGINTGTVTVGLMGSDQHILNYTVFGREVNLASRLEGISGRGRIIVSASTYRELQHVEPALAEVCLALPPVSVKGFREPVAIYEVEWRRLAGLPEDADTGLIVGEPASKGTEFAGT